MKTSITVATFLLISVITACGRTNQQADSYTKSFSSPERMGKCLYTENKTGKIWGSSFPCRKTSECPSVSGNRVNTCSGYKPAR